MSKASKVRSASSPKKKVVDKRPNESLIGPHVFREMRARIAVGAYRRMPEFKAKPYRLSKSQTQSLNVSLKRKPNARMPFAGLIGELITLVVQDRAIIARSPSMKEMGKCFAAIGDLADDAFESMGKLEKLIGNFDDLVTVDQRLPSQEVDPLDALSVASDFVRQQIVGATSLRGILYRIHMRSYRAAEHCNRAASFTSSKGDVPTLWLLKCLCEICEELGVATELPSNASIVMGDLKQENATPLYDFARIVLALLPIAGAQLMAKSSVDKSLTSRIVEQLSHLSKISERSLLNRLRAAKRFRGLTTEEFVLRLRQAEESRPWLNKRQTEKFAALLATPSSDDGVDFGST